MSFILVLMIYGSGQMAITAVSGFKSQTECVAAGEAWKRTKVEMERDYTCFIGLEKQ